MRKIFGDSINREGMTALINLRNLINIEQNNYLKTLLELFNTFSYLPFLFEECQ